MTTATTDEPQVPNAEPEAAPLEAYEHEPEAALNGAARANGRPRRPPVYAPPHDLDAEEALLGAMLLSDDARVGCDPADFYKPAHGHIAAAISTLAGRGDPVDPVTVADELRRTHLIDVCGGPAAIVALQAAAGPISSAAKYARIVAGHARMRRLDAAAQEVRNAVALRADPAPHLDRLVDLRDGGDAQAAEPDIDIRSFLDTEEPEYDWAVPGLFERRDRLIVTGGEGKGKSMLLRQLAVQLASGIHPFQAGVVFEPLRVFLLDLENSERQTRRKIRPIVDEAGSDLDAEKLRLSVRVEGLDLARPDDRGWLEERCAANRPEVLICGPIYKLADGDPDEEQDMKPIASFLDRLRARHGCVVILEAHTPHDSRTYRPSGWSGWKRWPEFGIYLDETGALIHWRGQRDERDWPRRLRRGGAWPWTRAADTDAMSTPTDIDTSDPDAWARLAIWQAFQKRPGKKMTGTSLKKAVRNEDKVKVGNSDFWRVLADVVADHAAELIIRPDGRGKSYTYVPGGNSETGLPAEPEPDPWDEVKSALPASTEPWSDGVDPFDDPRSFEA